ncbi:Glutathione transport system permease protein GsiD [bacterium HR12]|nr:Glutathione transport system permease protein GsiD [bacterium HR12]
MADEGIAGSVAAPGGGDRPSTIVGRSPWQIFWMRFRRDRVALGAGVFLVLLAALAITAPLIARDLVHHDPNALFRDTLNEIGLPKVGPSAEFWFGVDTSGRDVFVRTIYGARTSLLVALLSTGFAVVLGILLGSLAGYLGGWVDTVISRAIDLTLSLPVLLFSIGIAAACSIKAEGCLGGLIQPGISLVTAIIALFTWPYIGRIVRGQVLTIRNKEFIEAARAMGASTGRILLRDVLPNLAAPIIVYGTLIIPSNILFEAALSFLGVGIPPTTPSWGRMISDAARGQLYTVAWWMLFFPGMALVLTTLAFNLVGDGLRDALDPRTQVTG